MEEVTGDTATAVAMSRDSQDTVGFRRGVVSGFISMGGQNAPVENAAITRRQIVIIMFAVLMATVDGFDAFSMAFVAPVVGREWALDNAVLGILLSSGFAGMALGSFFISPVADVRGRRPVVLGSLALMTIGSFLSAAAHSVAVLTISRVVTGLGLGALVTLTSSIAAEFANARYRALVVSIASQGFAVGNIIGGLATAVLLKTFGWRSVFLSGAIAGAALLVLLAFFLLESPAYLLARRTPDALPKLNRVLTKLGHAQLAELPLAPQHARSSYRALFVPGAAKVTIQLMLVDVLLMMASFYLLSWLPQFVTSSGFAPASASIVSALTASSGVVGGVLVGAVAMFFRPARVAALSMVAMGLFIAVVGSVPPNLTWLTISAALFGFFLSPSLGVLYALMTETFPPLARTSGMGLVVGAGRIAGAAGPALAGGMFAAGWSRWAVSALFAAAAVIAGAILISMKPHPTTGAIASR